jgi:hypothetical protein
VATIPSEVQAKGVVGGLTNSGLDAIPFAGIGKGVVEIFTGDLIPDIDPNEPKSSPGSRPTRTIWEMDEEHRRITGDSIFPTGPK